MMKREAIKLKRTAAALFAAVFTALALVFFADSAQGVRVGLTLCCESVIPALFPLMFTSDLLSSALMGNGNERRSLLCAIGFGLLAGYPMGARLLSRAVLAGELERKDASLLLCALVNAGPAFILSGVGACMFSSVLAGAILLTSQLFASLAILFFVLLKTRGGRKKRPKAKVIVSQDAPDLIASVSFALKSTAALCANVVLFSCLGACVRAAAGIAHSDAGASFALLLPLEVTEACRAAADVGSLSGIYLACAALSLCGLCVISQVSVFAKQGGISLAPFLLSRPLHLALSLSCASLLIRLLPNAVPAIANAKGVQTFSRSPSFALALFALCAVFVLCDKTARLFTKSRF